MKLGAVALLSCLLFAGVLRADDGRAATLIRQLDSDDPAERDAATRELGDMGPEALPALDAAALKDGEAGERARRAAQRVRVRGKVSDLEKGEGGLALSSLVKRGEERKLAIEAWAAAGRHAGQVERLIDLLEFDAGGDDGQSACEILNWIMAPAWMDMADKVRTCRMPGEPVSSRDALQMVSDSIDLDISEAAEEALQDRVVREPARDEPGKNLWQLRQVCREAGLAFAMRSGKKLCVGTPAETAALWRMWWSSVREDRFERIALGLDARPCAATLPAADLDAWIERLRDALPIRRQVARSVLKDVTEAQAARIAACTARPDPVEEKDPEVLKWRKAQLEDFAWRLSLRSAGRLVFLRGESGSESLWVMNLDGSGEMKLSGRLRIRYSPPAWSPPGKDCVRIVASEGDAPEALWELDLKGQDAPKLLSKVVGLWRPDSPLTMAAVWGGEDSRLRLVDLVAGTEVVLDQAWPYHCLWSPDGERLLWNLIPGDDIKMLDRAAGKSTCVEGWRDVELHQASFSSDGRFLATRHSDIHGKKNTSFIELLDPATLERKTVIGPFPGFSVGRPEWSPDGASLAAAWIDMETLKPRVAVRDSATGKVRELEAGAAQKDPQDLLCHVCWRPDGRELHVSHPCGTTDTLVDLSTGKWTEVPRVGFAQWIPGTGYMVSAAGDVIVHDLRGHRSVNLTETDPSEVDVVPLSPRR